MAEPGGPEVERERVEEVRPGLFETWGEAATFVGWILFFVLLMLVVICS
jgi:hypothetical protein